MFYVLLLLSPIAYWSYSRNTRTRAAISMVAATQAILPNVTANDAPSNDMNKSVNGRRVLYSTLNMTKFAQMYYNNRAKNKEQRANYSKALSLHYVLCSMFYLLAVCYNECHGGICYDTGN